MKIINYKLVLLVALLAINFSLKAIVPITVNFEPEGSTWGWQVFANGAAQDPSNYSIVSNPLISGINTSTTCAKFIVNPDAARWAGVLTGNNPAFTVDSKNCIVKIMVYKNVISPFQLEFKGSTAEVDPIDDALQVSNTQTNRWEELTFDFTPFIGHTYACMVIIPDFPAAGRTAGSTNYWDNISFSGSATGIQHIKQNNISLFPNPVKDFLNFKSNEVTKVIIQNLIGQTVKVKDINVSETSVDVIALPAGSYNITLMMKNGSSSTQKFIKL